jgi:HK97 family phage major capsid protein
LLPQFRTVSNSIEVPKETSYTNNAAPQYSAGAYENVLKAESALSFSLTPTPVSTVAHWIPASRQILDDAPGLQGYVDSRLMFGLKLKEEAELLNGSGIQGHLSGLVTNATAYDTAYTDTNSDTFLDVIRHAMTQIEVNEMTPDAVILNPKDTARVQLTKESGTGISSGQYIWGNPHTGVGPSVWGLPIVSTSSMTEGQFLVGAFQMAAAIWDRQDASVEVSREHSDFFTRNMVAILCEERLALTVFRSDALIYGGFPFGS